MLFINVIHVDKCVPICYGGNRGFIWKQDYQTTCKRILTNLVRMIYVVETSYFGIKNRPMGCKTRLPFY